MAAAEAGRREMQESPNLYAAGRDPHDNNRDYYHPDRAALPPSALGEDRMMHPGMLASGWIAGERYPVPPNQVMGLSDRLAAMELAQRAPAAVAATQTKDLVVQVIEAAESVLRDQASALREMEEENERLRSTLRMRESELQNPQVEATNSRSSDTRYHNDYQAGQSSQHVGNLPSDMHSSLQGSDHQQETSSRDLWIGNALSSDIQSSMIPHPTSQLGSENNGNKDHGKQPTNVYSGVHYDLIPSANGSSKTSNLADAGNHSKLSSQLGSSTPLRSSRDLNPDMRLHLRGQALPHSLPEANSSNGFYNQEMVLRPSRPHEEIKQLRKLVQDAAIKEMQLVQEKYILEKRISDLHTTVDRYQNQLVEAASRAILIRQDVVEENARLMTSLRATEQDLSVYEKSLLQLLAEYNLQPAVTDAHSIVSGIKALVQHLQGLTNYNEGRFKDLHSNKQHWNQSSPRAVRGNEIVPQFSYPRSEMPVSPKSPFKQTLKDWEANGQYQVGGGSNDQLSDSGSDRARRSPYLNPSSELHDGRSTPKPDYDTTMVKVNESFHQADEEAASIGGSFKLDLPEGAEPSRRSPKLPTLHEEPGSSGSEADDQLPSIEGLCINGDCVLGSKIGASGYSINGTSLCHFQWVRHYRDGTFKYIPGAAQPEYILTADDVGTRISLECTPMDDRNRKGKMITVFANDQNRIELDSDIEEKFTEYIAAGQVTFELQFWMDGFSDNEYQTGILTLKQSGYELKRTSSRKSTVVSEKYTEELLIAVGISNGNYALANIQSSRGEIYRFLFEDGRHRDLVVLTMRGFLKVALDRRRAKKSFWLSKK